MLIDIVYWAFEQCFKRENKELVIISIAAKSKEDERAQNYDEYQPNDKRFDDHERLNNTNTKLKHDLLRISNKNVSFDYFANDIWSS